MIHMVYWEGVVLIVVFGYALRSTFFVVLWFGVVALCFVTTTRALRSVLGKIFVMVLLCHSSECRSFVCNA